MREETTDRKAKDIGVPRGDTQTCHAQHSVIVTHVILIALPIGKDEGFGTILSSRCREAVTHKDGRKDSSALCNSTMLWRLCKHTCALSEHY